MGILPVVWVFWFSTNSWMVKMIGRLWNRFLSWFRQDQAIVVRPKPAVSFSQVLRNDFHKTAVHEAGHAILAWVCTGVSNFEKVSITTISQKDGFNGCVKYYTNSRNSFYNELIIALGGMVAEILVYKKVRSAVCKSDLINAHKFSQEVSIWESKNGKTPPFSKMFNFPIFPREEAILSSGYLKAKEVILAHETDFYRLISLFSSYPEREYNQETLENYLGKRDYLDFVVRESFFIPTKGDWSFKSI